mgnify:CR=1 FL=1
MKILVFIIGVILFALAVYVAVKGANYMLSIVLMLFMISLFKLIDRAPMQ